MSQSNIPQSNNKRKIDFVSIGILVFFIILGLIASVVVYNMVVDMVTKNTTLTTIPGLAINEQNTPAPNTTGVPTLEAAVISGAPTPQPWDGATRVNVLLMGLDYRDWTAIQKNEPSRTDSMIVFTFDPITKTAGFLSIPRDMWVEIPGYDHGKINTAHFLGQLNNLPGSGPALATKAVENFLGVKIDYYAEIDFNAFVKFIDTIGCIDLKIKKEEEGLVIDPLGPGNTIKLQAGTQMICGEAALAYARARHSENGDFDRATRQQTVIMAIRSQVLNIYSLPKLVSIAPQLYNDLSAGIKTNLPLDMAIKLAWSAKDVTDTSIKKLVIAPDMVSYGKVVGQDGVSQDIIKPLPDKIRVLRDQLFTSGGALGPSQADIAAGMRAEGARVSLQNGTSDASILERTKAYLQSLGVNVVEATNAPNGSGINLMTVSNAKPYTMKYLSQSMRMATSNITNKFNPSSQIDLTIIIGSDWVANNPLPK